MLQIMKLKSVIVILKEKINEVVWVHSFDRNDQGEPCVFFLTYKNDSACLHLSTIHDDFSVSRKEYGKWESPNYWEPYDSYASTNAVLNKDGSVVLSFPLENPFFYPLSLRVMRFDGFGNVVCRGATRKIEFVRIGAKTLGPEFNLAGRFLAGNIEDLMSCRRQFMTYLQ